MRNLLTIIFSFITLLTFSQGNERIFDELKKKVQLDSYYDSASVFRSGNKAIELARRMESASREAEILVFYGNHFFYNHRFDVAKEYYRQAYLLGGKEKNISLQRLILIRLAYIMAETGYSEEADLIFLRTLVESQNDNDIKNQIESLNALGIQHERKNKAKEATSFYLQALQISEKNNEDYYTSILLNNLGLIKANAGQDTAALNDFGRALKIAQAIPNPRLAGHLHNNIGIVHMMMGNHDEALRQYEGNLYYARIINHPRELAVSYINYASVNYSMKKYDKSIPYYDSAIVLLEQHNMRYELGKGLLGKAQVLIAKKQHAEAISLINKSIELCTETENLEDMAGANDLLYRIYEEEGNYNKALDSYKEFMTLKDSLSDLRNTKAISELQLQYEVEKKDHELEQSRSNGLLLEKENELEKERKRIILGIGIGLILIMLSVFYIRYIRSLRKQQEYFSQLLIQQIEQERSRIAKDLHDDIGQSLSVIKSKLSLHAGEYNGEANELESDVGRIIEQTREISRNLYPSYLEKIGLVRSVARLSESVQKSSMIECSFDISDDVDLLPVEMKTHLYRILQECVSNTIRHADAKALKITIGNKGEIFQLVYQDNGKGLSHSSDQKGIGFLGIRERAKMLNGDMHLTDNAGKGFKLIIKFTYENFKVK
jgi:two-component system, NarL family, sensor kinase